MAKSMVIFDGQCPVCQGSVGMLRRLDWLHRLEFVDAYDPEISARVPAHDRVVLDRSQLLRAIHVVAHGGQVMTGYEAVRHLAGQLLSLMWAYPLLFLPGVTWLGPRLYAWIAHRRYRIGRLLGWAALCEQDVCRPIGKR